MKDRMVYILVITIALTAAFAYAANAHAADNYVEFRPVLLPEEARGKKVEKINIGPEVICVCQLYYLADVDVEKVEIFRSLTKSKSLMVGFKFNKSGRKKLYRFTKKFAKKRVAIFINGKLVTVPVVWSPYFMGEKVVVNWPGTMDELFDFATKVNNQQPDVISLYIEEQGKYNDIAADEWAGTYEAVNKYMEARMRQFSGDQSMVESSRGGE